MGDLIVLVPFVFLLQHVFKNQALIKAICIIQKKKEEKHQKNNAVLFSNLTQVVSCLCPIIRPA